MGYGNVVLMGASATQLIMSRLDAVQKVATSLCQASLLLFRIIVMLPQLRSC